jgi:Tfp pilus assembly protein PilO
MHKIIFFSKNITRTACFLVLLLAAVLIVFLYVIPLKKNQLQQSTNDYKATLQSRNQFSAEVIEDRSISNFYEQLISSAELEDTLGFFFEQAAHKSLKIETTNFHLEEQKEISFAIYKMQVPISGTYINILSFTQKVLETYPTIALIDISLGRENSNSNFVDGQLEFWVYTKKTNDF